MAICSGFNHLKIGFNQQQPIIGKVASGLLVKLSCKEIVGISTRKMATSVKATCESMAALPSGKHTKNYGKSPNIERITDLWGLVKSP